MYQNQYDMNRNLRIWLIDDDSMNNVYNSYLIEEYFPAFTVESFLFAGDALKQLQKFPKMKNVPDVLFVDISMPIIDGWEFLDACQEYCGWMQKRCSVFMLTASDNPKDPSMAVKHPLVSGFIQKPLKVEFLNTWLLEYNATELKK
jgi:CheY-like chemotaxis protein